MKYENKYIKFTVLTKKLTVAHVWKSVIYKPKTTAADYQYEAILYIIQFETIGIINTIIATKNAVKSYGIIMKVISFKFLIFYKYILIQTIL